MAQEKIQPPTAVIPEKTGLLNVKLLRRLLLAADDLMHFAVAVVLVICAVLVLAQTLPNLLQPSPRAILHVLNDVLLSLIIMELMWPIVRFLKRKPFSLNPFIYIGIISSTRRILLIEAEHSMVSRLSEKTVDWQHLWPVLAEIGVNVVIILVLAIALRILCAMHQVADD